LLPKDDAITMLPARITDLWLGRYRQSPGKTATTTPAVVITGGSEGIGLALAQQFSRDPRHRIVLIARRPDALVQAATVVRPRHGTPPLTLALDITAPDACLTIDRFLAANGLHLDTLVNNAGIGLSGAFVDASPDAIDRLISLNVSALARLTRHALPDMLARGHGGILNVASMGGLTPGPYQATYYASKAFVISLTQAVRAETVGRGVRIAVLVPGPVETRFHALMHADTSYYRRFMRSPSPAFVARVAYRRFRWGQTTIIPGLNWAFLALCMKLTPQAVSTPIVRWLLRPRA
jgi:uncharacterized protein